MDKESAIMFWHQDGLSKKRHQYQEYDVTDLLQEITIAGKEIICPKGNYIFYSK